MIVECPHCQSRCKVPDRTDVPEDAKGKCPSCQQTFYLKAAIVDDTEVQRRVLIVDDSLFFREMLQDIIAPLAYRCSAVSSAQEAQAVLDAEAVDLLIVDINMPGQNGAELIRILRQNPAHEALKILAVSSVYRREKDRSVVMRAGADGFLNKSFRPEEFQQTVKDILGDDD